MISRQYDHDVVAAAPGDGQGSQADAGGGVFPAGLNKDIFCGDSGALGHKLPGMLVGCDYENVWGGGKPGQPVNGLLQQSYLAGYGQQLFWPRHSAHGPKPGSFSSGHDNDMHDKTLMLFFSASISYAGLPVNDA